MAHNSARAIKMTVDTSLVSLTMSVVGWIAFLAFVVKVSMRFGALELKVDTMWGFQMRRAMSEVVHTGIGTKNSPLVLNDEVLDLMAPMRPKLQAWYQQQIGHPNHMHNDANLLLGLEQEFGDEITEKVCIPCKVTYGACLIIAFVVAKGGRSIDLRVGRDSSDR